jgi:hypothetical protein
MIRRLAVEVEELEDALRFYEVAPAPWRLPFLLTAARRLCESVRLVPGVAKRLEES